VFHFIVINSGTGESRTFERPLFTPELKARLVAFTEAAEALNRTSFVGNWNQTHISIHMAIDGRVTNTSSLPSDDEIAAFLHRLRPFYLQKEAFHFNTVCNTIGAHICDDAVTDCLREWKRHYDARASRQVFEIAAAGKILNSEEFLDHYLNAYEYHYDPDRRKAIDDISAHFPLEAQKAIIVLLLSLRLNAINKLASFLLTCFSREDGQPITLQMA
jgi:hypothetical protein